MSRLSVESYEGEKASRAARIEPDDDDRGEAELKMYTRTTGSIRQQAAATLLLRVCIEGFSSVRIRSGRS